MARFFNFHSIILTLENSDLVAKIDNVYMDEIAQRGFYKIKCTLLPSKYNLSIKFIKTNEEFIYAYQLYSITSIVRWDNEPHYPGISTFPHHFHDTEGPVKESNLTGEPEKDLAIVLKYLKDYLVQN